MFMGLMALIILILTFTFIALDSRREAQSTKKWLDDENWI